MKQHNRKYLRKYRKSNRKRLTPAEATLSNQIKRKQLNGRKFRRQHSIENYIVDFYCASENLIVELDGEFHNDLVAEVYDHKRDQFLKEKGFKILRFENRTIFNHLSLVLAEIRDNFKSS